MRSAITLGLLLLCTILFPAQPEAQTGALDNNFGKQGFAAISFGTANNRKEAGIQVLTQKDDKAIVVVQRDGEGVLIRYNTDGSIDPSFGFNGITLPVGISASSAYIQQDGKILLVGTARIQRTFAMARFNPNGLPDKSFGSNGIITTSFDEGPSSIKLVTVLPDGKIIAAGNAGDPTMFAIAHYHPDGSLDPSFSGDGKETTQPGQGSASFAAGAFQQDGKIVVTGMVGVGFTLSRLNADGSLDDSFDEDGWVTTATNFQFATASAVAIQPDGKIVAAGEDRVGQTTSMLLVRYNPDGTLDPSFSEDGKAYLYDNLYPFPATQPTWPTTAHAVYIQPDGKILTAGKALAPFFLYHQMVVARLNADGSKDLSFGSFGSVMGFATSLGVSLSYGNGLALTSDGRIYTVATGLLPWVQSDYDQDYVVLRFTPNGAPDPSFSDDGRVATFIPYVGSEVKAAAVQPDGKILVAGATKYFFDFFPNFYRSENFCLARINTDGTLDETFGTNGIVNTSFSSGANAIALQPDGKILLGGIAGLIRYNPDGSLDPTFDENGIIENELIRKVDIRALTLQPDGKILAAGGSENSLNYYDFTLLRLHPDGSPDLSFGGTGIRVNSLSNNNDIINQVKLLSDGRILAAGSAETAGGTSNFAFAQYLPDGSPDAGFAGTGKLVMELPGAANALSVQPDGKIVAAGYSTSGSTEEDFAIIRLMPDGVIDQSFGNAGKVLTDFEGKKDAAVFIEVLANGKILTAGRAQQQTGIPNFDFALAQYNPDGMLDISFGEGGKTLAAIGTSEFANAAAMGNGKLYIAGNTEDRRWVGLVAAFQLEETITLACPENITVATEKGLCTATITGIDPRISPAGANAAITYELKGATTAKGNGTASGQQFNKGITTVTYTVAGEPEKSCTFNVTVTDTEAPVITGLVASPNMLGPANHKMVDVYIDYNSTDNCGPTQCALTISSNEPENGQGDGDTAPDWQVMDNHRIQLRAERAGGGNGRVYTITLTCKDAAGNVATKTTTVTVPKNFKGTYSDPSNPADQSDNGLQVFVAPNPATEYFQVRIASSNYKQSIQIKVLEATGRIVETRTGVMPGQVLQLGNNYLPGVYFLEVTQSGEKVITRVIKQSK